MVTPSTPPCKRRVAVEILRSSQTSPHQQREQRLYSLKTNQVRIATTKNVLPPQSKVVFKVHPKQLSKWEEPLRNNFEHREKEGEDEDEENEENELVEEEEEEEDDEEENAAVAVAGAVAGAGARCLEQADIAHIPLYLHACIFISIFRTGYYS